MRKSLLLVPMTALVLGGCSSIPFLNKAAEKVTQTAEEKVAQEILKNCKFDKDACKFMANAVTAMSKAITIKSESTDEKGEKSTTEMKLDGKDNMQITSFTGSKETSAMISLDKVTYTKDYKQNVWLVYKTVEESPNPLTDPKQYVDELKKTVTQEEEDDTVMNKLGEEPCDASMPGLTCFKYESYQQKTPTEKTITWFDTKQYMMRKTQNSFAGSTDVSLYYYDPVVITKPSPVKEVTMPSYDGGTTGKAPSKEEIDQLMKQYSEQQPESTPEETPPDPESGE